MKQVNIVAISGNATRDGELSYTPSNMAILKFGVANNRSYKKGDEWVEETTFVDVVTFGSHAETMAKHVKKGMNVLVQGRVKEDRWESKEGQKRSKLNIVADCVMAFPKLPKAAEADQDDPF